MGRGTNSSYPRKIEPSYPRLPRVSRRASTQARSSLSTVIPAQAGSQAASEPSMRPAIPTAQWSRSAPPPNVHRQTSRAYCVDSCLRRNDGKGACREWGCGNGLGAHCGEIPAASAGMTGEVCAGDGEWRGCGGRRKCEQILARYTLHRSGGLAKLRYLRSAFRSDSHSWCIARSTCSRMGRSASQKFAEIQTRSSASPSMFAPSYGR